MMEKKVYRYRWIILTCIMVSGFSTASFQIALSTMFPKLMPDLGIDKVAAGLIISVLSWSQMVMSLPAGLLVDKYGLRKTGVLGISVTGLLFLIIGCSRTYYPILLYVFISGVSQTVWSISSTKGLILWFPHKERATVSALMLLHLNLSRLTIIPLITYFLSLGYHWSAGIFLIAGLTLASGVLDFLFYKDSPEVSPTTPSKTIAPLRSIINRNFIISVLTARFFVQTPYTFVTSWGIVFLTEEMSLAPMVAAGVMSAWSISGMLRPVGGVVNNKFFGSRRKPQVMLFCFLEGISCLFIAFLLTPTSPYWLILALFVSHGILRAMVVAPVHILPLEMVPKEAVATAGAISTMLVRANFSLFIPLLGWIAQTTGSFHYAWILVGLLATVAPALLNSVKE